MNGVDESRQHMGFNALLASWVVAALIFAFIESRFFVTLVIPVAFVLWQAANAVRLKQSTQLVLPILLLPGTLMCFVGAMQAFGYGRMADEALASFAMARAAYFIVGLALHFYALWRLANESRASDHPSGECVERI